MAKVKLTDPDVISLFIGGRQIDADGNGNFDLPDDAAGELAEHGLGIKPGKGASSNSNTNGGNNG